ncbi:MAG: helix-turn-helix domain-containing protein [Solobacterium sp.]|nr:helix-turn-helix domain-containing protein [Solobacterium sp.]
MLTYNLDIEPESLWLRTTPTELALKQSFFCTEAGIFYAKEHFYTERDYKDSYLLFFTIEGCGIIHQNDTTIRLLPGMAVVLNCRSPQSYRTASDVGIWTHYWIHFDGEGMKGIEELLIPNQRNTAVPVRSLDFKSHIETILENLKTPSSSTVLEDSLLLHTLLTGMVLRPEEPLTRNHKLIEKSAAYIQQHFTEHIKFDDLLHIAHMSRAYYMRMFRKYMGTTPYNYILSLRITQAKEYLEVTDMSVHEIALATGFSDDASFSTRFSSMVGVSPLNYRKLSITHLQHFHPEGNSVENMKVHNSMHGNNY